MCGLSGGGLFAFSRSPFFLELLVRRLTYLGAICYMFLLCLYFLVSFMDILSLSLF